MERRRIDVDLSNIPSQFHTLLDGVTVYDSSSSPAARVLFVDREGGYFLKSAAAGSLRQEAAMTAYFHSKGLSAQVLTYETGEQDWLLTRALPGQDCLAGRYLAEPERLCDTTAGLLRWLHETPCEDCPVKNRTQERLKLARENFESGNVDTGLFPDNWGYATAEDAWKDVQTYGPYLKKDTLLHGDYCLPNILLDDWKFSGFIDLDSGGVGDRHIDLFWGSWTLRFNLHTDAWCSRFLDAYGRDRIEPEILRAIAAFEVFN